LRFQEPLLMKRVLKLTYKLLGRFLLVMNLRSWLPLEHKGSADHPHQAQHIQEILPEPHKAVALVVVVL
ncbi:MAG: hypothetical protein ACRCWC_13530, partial [Plesiomonas shigelloides]